MAFKTGRTKSGGWSFDLSGTNAWTVGNRRGRPPGGGVELLPISEGTFNASAGGWSVSVVPYVNVPLPAPFGDAYSMQYGVTVTVTGPGDSATSDTVHLYDTFAIAEDNVTAVSYDVALTFTCSNNNAEWFEEIVLGAGWLNNIPDAPRSTQGKFYLDVLVGGSGGASCGGASLSTSSYDAGEGAGLTASMSVSGQAERGGSGGYSINMTAAPIPYSVPSGAAISASSTGAGSASSSADGGGVVATVAASTTVPGTPCVASGSSTLYGDKQYTASGVVRAMETAYPDSVGVLLGGHVGSPVTATGGSWTASGTQLRYTCIATALTESDVKDVNQWAPLTALLNSADLVTHGDEKRLTRAQWRGFNLAGITIAQAGSYTLEDGASATGWTGATSSGGVLTATAGTMDRTYNPKKSGLSYRYLRIRCRSVGTANQPFAVTVPGNVVTDTDRQDVSGGGSVEYENVYDGDEESDKSWSGLSTGADGAWKDVDIDLCQPTSLTDTTDPQDSRFPLPSRMPLYYGISRFPKITLSGLPFGGDVAFEVDSIILVQKTESTSVFDCLESFYPHQGRVLSGNFVMDREGDWYDKSKWRDDETLDSGTTIEYRGAEFLRGRVDGKASVDEHGLTYTVTTTESGSVWSFSIPSIANLAGSINATDTTSLGGVVRYPGITATIGAPVSDSSSNLHDGYLNRNLPGVFLAGAGAWYTAADGWQYGFDLPAGAIPAQTLYDSVEWYPDCGDAFGLAGGAATGPISLFGASILRAGAQGLVWGNDRLPDAGITLTALEGTTARGTGTTDAASGYAQTGADYLKVPATYTGTGTTLDPFTVAAADGTIKATGTGTPRSVSYKMLTRRRHRGGFLLSIVAQILGIAVLRHDLSGWFGKVYISGGTTIDWQRTDGPYTSSTALLPVVTVGTATGAERFGFPCLTIDPTGQNIIRLRYERNDGAGNYSIYEQQSYDDGATWSAATVAIANGRMPQFGRELNAMLGVTLETAWVPDSSGATVGVLKGAYRSGSSGISGTRTLQKLVGSTLSDFRITDAGYGVTQLPENQARWIICCVIEGETDTSDWVSADEFTEASPTSGGTFTRLT